jgi:hypothetical protein
MFAHQRLRAWGLNTMGAWSEPVATAMKRTPYTAILRIDAPRIAPGLDVPDVYDRAFPKAVRAACEVERRASGDDPWCIGVFVDNEIEWRNGPEIVPEILTAPAEQPGKRALCSFLRQRHGNIAKLNAAWSTAFRTWTDWLVSTNKFSPPGAEKDLAAFNEDLTDRYYRIAAQVFKRAMPYRLNLGTRFHTGNRAAIRAAAKYCDVVSFNKYAHSVRGIPLPEGINRPILVGEFHFAAWDRSFTASPARSALSLAQRADAYRYYVASALDDPRVVGVHWFQYLDQPLTGRADGENWPVGFVDVTDTPYESLTAASREIGELMYQRRSANRAIRP